MNEWQLKAAKAAEKIVSRKRKPFRAEEILPLVIEKIGPAPDQRNFGGVIRRRAADGTIITVRYSPAETSNGGFKRLWWSRKVFANGSA